MFFSIITVTLNAEDKIETTLKSIVGQQSFDYEWIVVDGVSKDNTLKIANCYSTKIPNFKVICEMDNGIYDAMNKGVEIAEGEYIIFINSGDYFIDSNVLNEAKRRILESDKNDECNYIFQGNIIREGKKQSYPKRFHKLAWILLEHAFFAHQGIFAGKNTLKNNKFDMDLRVCADREWFLCAMKNGAKYVCWDDFEVAYYDSGASNGYSSQQQDSLEISRRHGGLFAYYFVKFKRVIGVVLGHAR